MANLPTDGGSTAIAAEDTTLNRRKIKNLLVKPAYSLRMSFVLIGVGIASFAITAAGMLWQLGAIDELLNAHPEQAAQAQTALIVIQQRVIQWVLAGFAAFVMFSSIYVLVLNHRVAGPAGVLVKIIDAYKRQDFSYSRELRASDELQRVHKALRELGEELQKKSGD